MKSQISANAYFSRHEAWQDALVLLRNVFLSTELEETIKWGIPVYTLNGKNIAGLAAFKSYLGIWFYQGALLKDKKNVLINASEGKTKSLRQWRFNSIEEIDKKVVAEYINEAIQNQKLGREIKPDRNKPLIIPGQLKQFLEQDKKLNEAFNNLSRSCKREYADYIGEAKREETRIRRLEKIKPMILNMKGLNDKYRK